MGFQEKGAVLQKQQQATSRNTIIQLLAELKASRKTRNLVKGKQIHAKAAKCGHDSNVYVASAVISMYAKCGSMVDATQFFDSLNNPDVVSWNALILGYAENGQELSALDMFIRMRSSGLAANHVTFLAVLRACTSLTVKGAGGLVECRDWGRGIHVLALENGCHSNSYVQSSLIAMYAKCGSMVEARQVFDNLKDPDVVSCNVLILGYADNGQGPTAMNLFRKMRTGSLAPDSLTFVAALKACASLAVKGGPSSWAECRTLGKEIHNLAKASGCESNVYVQNMLIDIYAKCGSLEDARQVFDRMSRPDVVSWTVLILGYAEDGQGLVALDLFARMRRGGFIPDSVTLMAALKACTSNALKGVCGRTECRERATEVHDLAVKYGCDSNIYVQNTLIDMYAKCGSMGEAHQEFSKIKYPNLVSWNVLITGYADNGQGFTALDLFTRMKSEGHAGNHVTFMAVLKACSLVGGLEFGRTIHVEIDKGGTEHNLVLVTCLVDFYSKCGSLVEAESLFDLHHATRDVLTWNALLAGYSSCGDYNSVFRLFERMQDTGFKPNSVTFLAILMCCSHTGFVEKGRECFGTMISKYEISPIVEHYNCMVDILGRSNKLDDAMALLGIMPCSPDDVTWRIILSACRKWKNVEIGRLAFKSLTSLGGRDASLLIEQIYGMSLEQEIGMRKQLKVETCWTNEKGEVHMFIVENVAFFKV